MQLYFKIIYIFYRQKNTSFLLPFLTSIFDRKNRVKTVSRTEHLKPFKPGESGNPNGRPAGVKNRSTIARKWLSTELTLKNPLTGEDQNMTLEDAITLAQIKRAKKGSPAAYKVIMDSAHGAVQQKIDVTTDGEKLTSPQINVYNNAPPLATSENEIDNKKAE